MRSGSDDLISVITPVYNAEKTLAEAIESVLSQKYTNWELILVDDGSTDSSLHIASSYSRNDQRIKCFVNSKKGVSSARNYGIGRAIGKYICFLDADDKYMSLSIKKRFEYFLRNRGVQAVYCETKITDESFRLLGWSINGKSVITFSDLYEVPFSTNSVMVCADILKSIKFDEEYVNGEDWVLYQRLARTGIVFHRVDGCHVYYRQNESTVRKDMARHVQGLLKVIDLICSKDTNCPAPLKQYENGLSALDVNLLKCERVFGLMLYQALSGLDFDKAPFPDMLAMIKNEKISLLNAYSCIKYAVMRKYTCHEVDWKERALEKSNEIKAVLRRSLSRRQEGILSEAVMEVGMEYYEFLVANSLEKIFSKMVLGQKFVLFGVGGSSDLALKYLDLKKYSLVCFFDNDKNKQHGCKKQLAINEPVYIPWVKVVVASMHDEEIYNQLLKLGYKEDDIFSIYGFDRQGVRETDAGS